MTKLLQDILREPTQLAECANRLITRKQELLQQAATLLSRDVVTYVVGVGSSWNAALAVASMLNSLGYPAIAADASELQHFTDLPLGNSAIVLSRSGKSVEIVQLMKKFEQAQTRLIGITNTPESLLAERSDVTFLLDSPFDHLISISMYSLLGLVGCLIAETCNGTDLDVLRQDIADGLQQAHDRLGLWQAQLESADWIAAGGPVYFIARGTSLASCHEARLLWEEGAKATATALTTGSFRHGSQEMIRLGVRVGLWIQDETMREQDLELAADLHSAGVSVLLVGTHLESSLADLVIDVPLMPRGWQFLTDIIPLQLAAERTARVRGEDCDAFRFCPYIILDEGGLIEKSA
jgi:fructoselysine-6-P-deglycase FrlB-like protein